MYQRFAGKKNYITKECFYELIHKIEKDIKITNIFEHISYIRKAAAHNLSFSHQHIKLFKRYEDFLFQY